MNRLLTALCASLMMLAPAAAQVTAKDRKAAMSDLRLIELRQYTLHPGGRDALARIFENSFVGPQEENGIRVLGRYRDLDDPDRFVWMREFQDLDARARGLSAFYGGVFGPRIATRPMR